MRDIEGTRCQIAAAVIGNALEWYDFIVYGYLTVIISRLFFPAETDYASLLMAAATFSVGFVMRPVGGILIGLYADRKGRKAALQMIMLLMTAAIALIAFAPTYASIGIAAPLMIVLARLLQGLATGGRVCQCHLFSGGNRAARATWLLWFATDDGAEPRRAGRSDGRHGYHAMAVIGAD